MGIEQRIAFLSREINSLISKYAALEMRKIKNVFITETGDMSYIEDPKKLDTDIDSIKEILNEDLFELDQSIGERDNLERQ